MPLAARKLVLKAWQIALPHEDDVPDWIDTTAFTSLGEAALIIRDESVASAAQRT